MMLFFAMMFCATRRAMTPPMLAIRYDEAMFIMLRRDVLHAAFHAFVIIFRRFDVAAD